MPQASGGTPRAQVSRNRLEGGYLEALAVPIAPQLVRHGNIDYLALDYLSEITMSLLTAVKQKNPVELTIDNLAISRVSHILQEFGYTPDFIHHVMTPLLAEIKQRS